MYTLTMVASFFLAQVRCEQMFPYKKMFGLNSQRGNIMLEMYHLCSSPRKQFAMQCECSEHCMKFHSCCIDALWYGNETLEEYIERFILEANKYKEQQCLPILNNLPTDRSYKIEKILMKAECSNSVTNHFFKTKCEKMIGRLSVWPVLGNDGNIYKNKYCAICNKNNSEFIRLNITTEECVVTPGNNNSKDIFNRYVGCSFKIGELSPNTSKANAIRRCATFPKIPTICDKKHSSLCQLCSSYVSGITVQSENKCYRNAHCYMALKGVTNVNALSDSLRNCPAYKISDPLIPVFEMAFSVSSVSSYSSLVSFKDLSGGDCVEGQIYDDHTKTCVTYYVCGPGFTQVGYKCKRTGNVNNEVVSDLTEPCLSNYMYFSFETKHNKENITRLMSQFPKMVKVHVSETQMIYKAFKNATQDFLTTKTVYQYETIITNVHTHLISELYNFDFSRSFPDSRLCAAPVSYQIEDLNLNTKNCSIHVNNTIFSANEYIVIVFHNRTELVICQKFHLQSPCFKRKLNNFKKVSDQIIKSSEKTYQPDEYLPLEDGIYVCITNPKVGSMKAWERIFYSAEHYVTIIGCTFSIISYLWVIMTYSIIPKLKTIPGKNIVCLCVSLLFCDVVMLITMGKYEYKVCAWIGVFLHYFALSVQIWTGIVAFDIWSTFHSRSVSRGGKTQKRFKLYLLVGFVLPFLLMIIFAILDFTKKIHFGYGINHNCWVTKFFPRLTTYIIPMAVITVLNIVFLSYTIIRIYKHARKSKKLLKKSGGNEMSLARMSLKLVVLLGAIEILGLMQTNGKTNNEKIFNGIVRIIYTFSRAFRGVFVWILYIATDRVIGVYKDIKRQGSIYTNSTTYSQTRSSVRKGSSIRRDVTKPLFSDSQSAAV